MKRKIKFASDLVLVMSTNEVSQKHTSSLESEQIKLFLHSSSVNRNVLATYQVVFVIVE